MAPVPSTLLDGVLRVFDPVQVILFGSRARGDHRTDSDIDLYVVVDDRLPNERLSAREISRARLEYRDPVDMILARASDHERRRGELGTLAKTVSEEGVIVYSRV